MDQLLQLSWWFSFFPQSAAWWFFCAVTSVAALPLCLRVFRGLADRGAGLSIGAGLIAVMSLAWLASMEWFTAGNKAALVRMVVLLGGCFLLALAFYRKGHQSGSLLTDWPALYPGALFVFLGLVAIPHGFFSVWFAVILLGLASAAAWAGEGDRLRRQLKLAAVPFLIAQLLFLVAFLFFVNVRSYIPYATFEIGLYQAEKWGNMGHLQSAMTTSYMPPKDIWFNEYPTNYYYGGHLFTATIAKATGTPAVKAFNLGLATIFALTFTMGFFFVYSLVHLAARRYTMPRGFAWYSGLGYGLLGAFAISMFGNLDAYRQLFTRDVDWGVNFRWEKAQQEKQQDWKVRTALPVSAGARLYAATVADTSVQAVGRLDAELTRLAAQEDRTAEQVNALADQFEERARALREGPRRSSRHIEDQLTGILFSQQSKTHYENLTSINAARFQEEAFQLLVEGRFDEITAKLREAADRHWALNERTETLQERFTRRISLATNSRDLRDFIGEMTRLAEESPEAAIFGTTASAASDEQAFADPGYVRTGTALLRMHNRIPEAGAMSDEERRLLPYLERAHARFDLDPGEFLDEYLGKQPPTYQSNPGISKLRFTWQNVSFLDFWAPSRVIKSSPPNEQQSGTITEFPYFSAILGDHHPHHAALPFTLAALCACLSLLRINSRAKSTDIVFLRRSWPALIAMAYFIGAVFPVNIWDAVVLSPLYAVTILVAWKGVLPSIEWKWVGFAGFIVLLALVCGVFFNSIPGAAPLFQNFKFFLLATAIVTVGLAVLPRSIPFLSEWITMGVPLALALVVVFAGGYLAPGSGGPEPPASLRIGMRDLLFFAVLLGISASWTMGNVLPAHRWWYSAGAIYAAVGILALTFVLPFQIHFQSPLEPDNRIVYEMVPPVLSHELVTAQDRFWQTFWSGSPVNPFNPQLRTLVKEYIVHWGIFFIPILLFAVGRFFRFTRETKNGFAFMTAMLILGIMVFARNYLRVWTGAISLGMMTLCLFYAFHFRRRSEGAIWAFLSVAFFWTWFVEALKFDDDYSGYLERYNTPFKIYYPLWPIFAGGMVVALREALGRFRVKERTTAGLLRSQEFWVYILIAGILVPMLLKGLFPAQIATVWYVVFWIIALAAIVTGILSWRAARPNRGDKTLGAEASRAIAQWPAFLVGGLIFAIGMYYPIGATATRTREFFTWPMVDTGEMRLPQRNIYTFRTLDSIAHYQEYANYRQDYKTMVWVAENIPHRAKILEQPSRGAYHNISRISAGSGRPTILGWGGHQHQWRGRAKAAPGVMKLRYVDSIQQLPDLNGHFNRILPGEPSELSRDEQNILRLSSSGERLNRLREHFPEATLMQLYRMRFAIEKNDINMMHIVNSLHADAEAMYRDTDREKVRRLFGDYNIEYVIAGELERGAYGADVANRFIDWGFRKIYDSSNPDNLLPIDDTDVRNPTIVLKVPDDFPITGDASQ